MSVEKIPFDANGDMVRCLYSWRIPEGLVWQPNEPFEAVLYYKDYRLGSSRLHTEWHDEHGHRYYMHQSHTMALLASGWIIRGRIYGFWGFRKIGPAYGIRLIDPMEA